MKVDVQKMPDVPKKEGSGAEASAGWGGTEHFWAGDNLTLPGLNVPSYNEIFTVGYLLTSDISFGRIVQLTGDHIGAATSGEIICQGATETQRRERAQVQRDRFASDLYATPALISTETSTAAQAKADVDALGASPNALDVMMAVRSHGFTTWDTIVTLPLLGFNEDHFGGPGKCAQRAYQTLHDLALEAAAADSSTTGLKQAYFYEAMAQHYLSDQFSAGHLRNPSNYLRGAACDVVQGGFAVHSMHEEDGYNGVYVTNRRGDTPWWAFGDYFYWATENADNKAMCANAMQAGINEVHAAWTTGSSTVGHSTSESPYAGAGLDYVPDIENSIATISNYWDINICPLFLVENETLYRRYPWNRPRSPTGRSTSTAPSRNRFGLFTDALPTIGAAPGNPSDDAITKGGCTFNKFNKGDAFVAGGDCGIFAKGEGMVYSPEAAAFLPSNQYGGCTTYTISTQHNAVCSEIEAFEDEEQPASGTLGWASILLIVVAVLAVGLGLMFIV